MNKKHILQFLIIISLAFIILRLVGYIELNFYTSQINGNQSASFGSSNELESYQINFEYNNKKVYEHLIINGEQEITPFSVKIESYTYEGNYFMPLYKNFTMHYTCTFMTPTIILEDGITESNQIKGQIEGTVELKIKGLCTIKKAKELAAEKAFNSMKDYVIQTLSH